MKKLTFIIIILCFAFTYSHSQIDNQTVHIKFENISTGNNKSTVRYEVSTSESNVEFSEEEIEMLLDYLTANCKEKKKLIVDYYHPDFGNASYSIGFAKNTIQYGLSIAAMSFSPALPNVEDIILTWDCCLSLFPKNFQYYKMDENFKGSKKKREKKLKEIELKNAEVDKKKQEVQKEIEAYNAAIEGDARDLINKTRKDLTIDYNITAVRRE